MQSSEICRNDICEPPKGGDRHRQEGAKYSVSKHFVSPVLMSGQYLCGSGHNPTFRQKTECVSMRTDTPLRSFYSGDAQKVWRVRKFQPDSINQYEIGGRVLCEYE